jgi:hypothetical protein
MSPPFASIAVKVLAGVAGVVVVGVVGVVVVDVVVVGVVVAVSIVVVELPPPPHAVSNDAESATARNRPLLPNTVDLL